MSKYYTPSIEEFHVGFEYERKNGDSWEKTISTESDYSAMYSDYGEENEFDEIETNIRDVRVKYLDKEDIESLGFTFNEETGWFEKKDNFGFNSYDNLSIQLHSLPGLIVVSRSQESSYQNEHYEFFIEIKNKSELKTFLRQIKYEK